MGFGQPAFLKELCGKAAKLLEVAFVRTELQPRPIYVITRSDGAGETASGEPSAQIITNPNRDKP